MCLSCGFGASKAQSDLITTAAQHQHQHDMGALAMLLHPATSLGPRPVTFGTGLRGEGRLTFDECGGVEKRV
jgi:hypothetical protein